MDLGALGAGSRHQGAKRALEPFAIGEAGEFLEAGDDEARFTVRHHRLWRGRRVVRHVGQRLFNHRVERLAAQGGLERGRVKLERRLDGRRGVGAGLVGHEELRRETRSAERQEQPFDLGAARATLAHQGQIEDLHG